MGTEEVRLRCPRCRSEVVRAPGRKAPFFPFCSERCKLIDLGKWLSEEHRIEEPLKEHREDQSDESPAP